MPQTPAYRRRKGYTQTIVTLSAYGTQLFKATEMPCGGPCPPTN